MSKLFINTESLMSFNLQKSIGEHQQFTISLGEAQISNIHQEGEKNPNLFHRGRIF